MLKRDLSIVVILNILIFVWSVSTQAKELCENLAVELSAKVVEIVDGDSVVLENGDKVRLIGMQAPKLALGREGFKDWPLAHEAKEFLSDMLLNKRVRLKFGGAKKDRHNRVLAHLFIEGKKEVWVQEKMIEEGFARVYSFADNRHCLDELLKAEAKARIERKNIWANEYYAIAHAQKINQLLNRVDRYELVEGRVLSVKKIGSLIYINFGADYKKDFTIVIDKVAQRIFKKSGINPLDYNDALIRVRGWVEKYNGPRIDVSHPEQIEVLAKK